MPAVTTWKPRGTPAQAVDSGEQGFRRKRAQLLAKYEGQFVALYRGRVVGHGRDDEELAQTVFGKLGDVPFYIAKVEREPTVYDLPSPEVVS